MSWMGGWVGGWVCLGWMGGWVGRRTNLTLGVVFYPALEVLEGAHGVQSIHIGHAEGEEGGKRVRVALDCSF